MSYRAYPKRSYEPKRARFIGWATEYDMLEWVLKAEGGELIIQVKQKKRRNTVIL